jgi:hypothetical protein
MADTDRSRDRKQEISREWRETERDRGIEKEGQKYRER